MLLSCEWVIFMFLGDSNRIKCILQACVNRQTCSVRRMFVFFDRMMLSYSSSAEVCDWRD